MNARFTSPNASLLEGGQNTDLDWRLLDFQLVPVSRADFDRECSAR